MSAPAAPLDAAPLDAAPPDAAPLDAAPFATTPPAAPLLAVPSAEEIADSGVRATPEVAAYALGLGDDALILSHRLSEWIARAPETEEDIALTNIGLDLLGHARSLLTYAGSAWELTEDDLAYFRDEPEFRCRQLFEAEIGDFAVTVARQLIASVYFDELYRALALSADPVLAAIAAKAVKESAYHVDHAIQWTDRLALGTEVSAARFRAGLAAVWPHAEELFDPDPAHDALPPGVGVAPASLRAGVMARIARILGRAGLAVPDVPRLRGGGRLGIHSEPLGHLLAEMQSLARQHPGATW